VKKLSLRKIFLNVLFLLFCFLTAISLTLSEENPFDPEIDRHIRLGGLRLRPFFAISDTGYDSNIYRRSENTTSDFTTTLSPGCDIFTYLGNRGTILLKEQVDFVFFASEDSQNHTNIRSMADINLFFNRFSFETKGEYDYLKERPNYEIDIRTRYTIAKILFASKYKHSSKTSTGLSLARKRHQYRDDEFFGSSLRDSLNRDEDSVILSYSQKMFAKTTVTLESEFVQYDFENKLMGRDADAEYYTIGFKFDPSAFISGDFKAGYASFTPDDNKLSDYTGLIGNASLSYRITEVTRMSLTSSKDILFSIYQDNLYLKQNSYGLSIFQFLTRRFGIEVGATLYKNRYTEPGNIPLEGGGSIFARRKDDIKTGYIEFKFRFDEQHTIGLKVSRWERESNVPISNVDRILAGFTFGYQF
jgi:hypothetical protein